jgi:hypothetical protein
MKQPSGLRFVAAIISITRFARLVFGSYRDCDLDWDEVLGCWVLSRSRWTSVEPESSAPFQT